MICQFRRLRNRPMADWRVLLLSAIAFLTLLVGLLVLALPDPYEGGVLYAFDAAHSIRTLDGVGLVLLVVGGVMAWGAGLLWQRRMAQ
jgi:hypothetical protein